MTPEMESMAVQYPQRDGDSGFFRRSNVETGQWGAPARLLFLSAVRYPPLLLCELRYTPNFRR